MHGRTVWLQHLVGSGNDYAHDRLTKLQSTWLIESHSWARHVHPHICGPNSSIGRVNRAEVKQASYLVLLVWQTGWQMLCSCWLKSLITIPFPIHTFYVQHISHEVCSLWTAYFPGACKHVVCAYYIPKETLSRHRTQVGRRWVSGGSGDKGLGGKGKDERERNILYLRSRFMVRVNHVATLLRKQT